MNTSVDAFIEHGLSTGWADLPEAARAAVKTFLLDSIGVGIAGAAAPLATPIRGVAGESEAGEARCLGGGTGRAMDAAFVNGFQIHCQEFDCVHEPAVVHPMATILASLLAVADAEGGVTGPELGAAISVAVDMAAGLGVAVKSPIRFFRPATAGIFGATLGTAKLMKLSHEQTRNALGYALAFAAGTMQAHVEGKPALPVQIANAAANAVRAAQLGRAGMEASGDSLTGPFGYLTLFESEWDLAPVTESLGKVHRITEVSHKPFPTGRAAQGGIVLMQKLRLHRIPATQVERIELSAPPLIRRLVGRPWREDMSANYARLCFQYSGAVAYLRGSVGLGDFGESMLRDAEVAALAPKIRIVDNGDSNPAAFTPQVAVLTAKDGTRCEARIDALFGSPMDPLTPQQNVEKFRACVAARFDGARGGSIADRIIEKVEALDSVADVRALTALAAGMEEEDV